MTAIEADETDESRGSREPQGKDLSLPPNEPKPPRFAETLKALFREVKQALTGKAPAPIKKIKRRRSGETEGGFRLAFKQLVRRVQGSFYSFDSYHLEPPDDIDESQRIHLWHLNNEEGESWHADEVHHQEPPDHLSLHM